MRRRRFAPVALLLCRLVLGLLMLGLAIIPAGAADPAGHVTRIKGEASVASGGDRRALAQGAAVFASDTVATGKDARLELSMIDGTKVTLGDDSELLIDDYVYSPRGKTGRGALTLTHGVFRAVTGALAKLAGEPFRVATPVASIGIRGTDFWGEQRADRLLIALLGGKAVVVENAAGRVTLTRRNLATRVEGAGQAPTQPFALTADQLRAAVATVAW